MTPTRQLLITGSLAWAAAGAIVGLSQLSAVNADARWLVGVASVVFPAAAVLAAMALRRGAIRWAAVLLLVSVATPTYYAYPLNIPALVAGLVLLAAPPSWTGSARPAPAG
ncbi:MAG: hypothetical protein QOD57_4643 [Actinomycetota bacterium]|nr:hypothetical protein [Actinomycetota bacterium]